MSLRGSVPVVAAVLLLAPALGLASSAPGASVPPLAGAATLATCHTVRMTVAIQDGIGAADQVYGELCDHASVMNDTIQLLLAGATEGGVAYWDFPAAGHSYVRYLADQGYAVLAIDRIGTGQSSHPQAAAVTIQSNAFVVHQVVQALKHGAFGHPFPRVITVGRSLSGPIMYVESTSYHDVDGMIVQSFSRTQDPPFFQFPTSFEPAQLEPRLANDPAGYFTTRPGTRAMMFFNASDADPAIIAQEESLKETITATEVATFPPSFGAGDNVAVPVYSIMGAADSFFCTLPDCPESQQESGYYPAAPCFANHVVVGAGHDMDLEYNATERVFPFMRDWVSATFAPGGCHSR